MSRSVYACRLQSAEGETELLLNAPQPWWFQADNGQQASPGGWLRVFGRCLALDAERTQVELRGQGVAVRLPVKEAGMWALGASVPKELAPGLYELWVHNGSGGQKAWVEVGPVTVAAAAPFWKEQEFVITDFGALPDDEQDDSDSFTRALKALADNGGGVLRFPAGRFRFQGGFTVPRHVLLRGNGMASTYLAWADTDTPPEALLAASGDLGIEDLSLCAFHYRVGLRVTAKAPDVAKNVRIQRIRVRFTPLTIRKLTPEIEMRRRAELGRSSVFSIEADNAQVLDCDLMFPLNIGFFVGGNDSVIARNTVFAQGGWCPVGSGRRKVIEENTFTGVTTGITRGMEVYFSSNRVSHTYAGDREGFTTDGGGGGPGELQIEQIDGAAMTYSAKGSRGEPPSVTAAVRILDGPGVGQFRRVLSLDGKRLVMDRPWDVPPEKSSVVCAGNYMGRYLFVGNVFSDTGVAVQLYTGALDCVVVGNRSIRSGGFRGWGQQDGPGPAPCWYVQFLDNEITEGYGVEGRELNGGQSSIHLIGAWGSGTYHGPTTRGVVIRGNCLQNHAHILLRANLRDVLIEQNTVRNARYGILGDCWSEQEGILLRANTFDHVAEQVSPAEAFRRYRSVAP